MANNRTLKKLKTFANEPVPVIGMMQTPVESNSWRTDDGEFVVVKDGLKPLIGRSLFDALGISVTWTLHSIEGNIIANIITQSPIKTKIANQSPVLISRIGLSKVHITNKIFKHFQPKQKKVEKYLSIYKSELKLKLEDYLKKDI